MKPPRSVENELILGLVSISDRASRGIYQDEGIPNLEAWCRKAITTPIKVHKRLIADERFDIEKTLRELVDIIGCDLILTTGGTGPASRDVTPEATLAVATREMPGFGEQMRAISGHFVPTAILSRQVGVLRETPDHAALIINLPGRPKAIAETLEGLKDKDGRTIVNGIFAAVPYCIDLIGGPYIETDERIVKAFRPKSAQKPQQPSNAQPAAPAAEADRSASPQGQTAGAKTEPAAAKAASAPKEPLPNRTAAEPARSPKPQSRPAAAPFSGDDLIAASPRGAGDAELCVVWLHGMGVDNRDFAEFPNEIRQFGGPICRFVLPNAPIRELSSHPGYPLRAWYDVPDERIERNEDVHGIRLSAERVSALIAQLEADGIPRRRIVLGGFSQGAALSLYQGLREPNALGGIVSLSGYLPLANRLYSEATQAGRETPIFMAHGEFDDVVPLVLAARSASVVQEVSPNLIWRRYPIEHTLGEEEMHDLAQFLRSVAARATQARA